MKTVYLANVVGAPSPTAVIVSENVLNKIDWKKEALEVYYFLKLKNIDFSKMAIINSKSKSKYDFKFIQIKVKDEILDFESNANCGNSMIASARVAFMIEDKKHNFQDEITIMNIDTNLEMSVIRKENSFDLEFNNLIGKSINDIKMFEGAELINIDEDYGRVKASIINFVNPYIIINAKDLGITCKEEILHLDESDKDVLERVKNIRRNIVKRYNFDKKSEFPKIAMVLYDYGLSARTIYVDRWHKGLPITAILSIAITTKIKDSIIYKPSLEIDEILTPQGSRKVNVRIDKKRFVSECKIFNIKSKGDINLYTYE